MKVGALGVVGVTIMVTLFGAVQSTPGILSDLFSFDSSKYHHHGPPPSHYRTVYVVKPPPGHGPPKHSHSSKPSFSLSPFSSLFSKPSYSSGSGWGSGGKRKPPQTVDEQTYKTLVESSPEHESMSGADELDMGDMIQNSQPEMEDPNSQVEVVRRPRPQSQSQPQSLRGMRPPQSAKSQRRPPSSSALKSQLSSRPSTFQGFPEAQTDDMSEMGMAEEEEGDMMGHVRGTTSSSSASSSTSGKRRPGKYSSGSSGSSGWSSGPKTVTYVSHGWGPSSGGWGWEPPVSHGWPSTFEADDYWPLGLGGGSSSGGWGGGSEWQPGSPGSGGSESDGEGEEEGGSTGEPEPEMMPETPVEETGTTEEGEDRRPVRPRPRPTPNFSSMGGSGPRRPTTASVSSRPRPTSSSTAPGRRPSSSASTGYGGNVRRPASSSSAGVNVNSGSSRPRQPASNMIVPSTSSIKTRPQGRRPNLPSTSDPLPDDLDLDNMITVDGGSSAGPRGNSGNNGGQQVMIAGQVVNNQDGLLDDELIRTVEQIIQKFDNNS